MEDANGRSSGVGKIPEVPEVPMERIEINEQCADIENWDERAFPLMIEPAVPHPPGVTNPFTTLSVETCETLVALLTKPLNLMTASGNVVKCGPVTEDHPDVAPLVAWLRGASASLRSRRSRR